MNIFIDTGAFLSRHLENDQFHKVSVKTWKELEKANHVFYTSNFIVNETLTLIARRAGGKFAVQVANHLYQSKVLNILRPAEDEEKEAIKLMGKFYDHQIGFTDCLSSVLMQKHRIPSIFTFDQHFLLWKFNIHPR